MTKAMRNVRQSYFTSFRRCADPIVSLPQDAFRKREPVHLRSAITGKIGSFLTIRQPQVATRAFPVFALPVSYACDGC
jgi:hypothetical protein